jgi:hypothetical protein
MDPFQAGGRRLSSLLGHHVGVGASFNLTAQVLRLTSAGI